MYVNRLLWLATAGGVADQQSSHSGAVRSQTFVPPDCSEGTNSVRLEAAPLLSVALRCGHSEAVGAEWGTYA